MPGTRSHESPPSWLLNKDAGSTPHHRSFLPPPASSDQMLTSARPSSLGNAGADFVSLKLFPMSVERNTFMPKNGLQLEAAPRLRGIGDEHAFLRADGKNDSIRHLQPPETAGRIVTTSPGESGVS